MVQAARGFTPQTNRFYFTSVLSNEAVLQSDFGDLPSKEGVRSLRAHAHTY